MPRGDSEKSIEICERLGMKLELGRAYASYGKTLKKKGDPKKACARELPYKPT